MMRHLPLLFLLLAPVLGFAQQFSVTPVVDAVAADRTDKAGAKSVPELIFPVGIEQSCADSATVYAFNDPESGPVTGTNSLLETAKIQRFIYPSDSAYSLTQVGVAFAFADSMIADRKIVVEIYNDLNADSTLGTFLAVSDSVLVSDIILPDSFVRYTTFTFPEPVLITRDSFWVSVEFSDIYNSEAGDVGIFSTFDNCGDGNNLFAVFPTGTGASQLSVASFLNRYNLNIVMFMNATVDPALSTSTRTPVADYGATISPNPTTGPVTLTFRAEAGTDYRVTLTDLSGRQLTETRAQVSGTLGQAKLEMSQYPSGLYLYHIDGPSGRQSGKVVVR